MSAALEDENVIYRLPHEDEHVAIIGRNGSGKTQAAVWVISRVTDPEDTLFILNFKDDELINQIPGATSFKIRDKLPRGPGVFSTNELFDPEDKDDKAALNNFFRSCWHRKGVRIFVDEGYNATGLKWFRACLSQGRSREVSMIMIFQRPVWADRFVWSEASQYMAFDLNLADDKNTTASMVPGYRDVTLPPYHCVWHNVKTDQTAILTPVPDGETILQRFRRMTKTNRKVI